MIDAESGRLRWVAEDWEAAAVAVHPSGASVAVASSVSRPFDGFHQHRIRVLDFATGAQLWALDGPYSSTIAFSPDGRLLAIAGAERARLFDAETGTERFGLGASSYYRMTPAFSADSRWVVSASPSRAFMLDTQTGAKRWDVAVPCNASRVAFAEDDRQVVVVCNPASVVTLDSTTGQARTNATLEGSFPSDLFAIKEFALSPDRRVLVKANMNAIGVYTVADGRRRFAVRPLTNGGSLHVRVQVSSAAGLAAVNASDPQPAGTGRSMMLFDPRTGRKVWERLATSVIDFAFSPDGRRLAMGGGTEGGGYVSVHDIGCSGPVTCMRVPCRGVGRYPLGRDGEHESHGVGHAR